MYAFDCDRPFQSYDYMHVKVAVVVDAVLVLLSGLHALGRELEPLSYMYVRIMHHACMMGEIEC